MSTQVGPESLHPDDAALAAWTQGELPPEAAGPIEQHLETCESCALRLEAIDTPPDPFLDRLRTAAGIDEPAPPPASEANLMFGALALQAGLITAQQLADACVLWSSRGGMPLADLMVEQGWIDDEARASVATLLAARVPKRPRRAAAETLSGRAPEASGVGDTLTLSPLPGERLRLKQLYSQGGIGQVWRAQDTLLGREVALKELLPELRGSRQHRERFFREARVAAQLSHPGTAPVYEYREENGRCYYTMKFYTGHTLTEVTRDAHNAHNNGDGEFVRLFPLLEHFLAVCGTIAYAHSQGIIHRDLKGENVVLGEYGEVTVIDWGLAKPIAGGSGIITPSREPDDDHPTLEGERLGTPGFMAPEQARGDLRAIDERTDVYGLAAVLYELLTTRPPFRGETANEVMHRVEVEPPTPPHVTHPKTPPELEAICLKGLSKLPGERFQSAAEIHHAVHDWLTHQLDQQQESDRQAKFFALSHDLFVTLDERGRVVQVNPAYVRHFGVDPSGPEGEHYADRMHPDDLPVADRMFRQVLQGVSQRDTVLRVATATGDYLSVSWSLTRVSGEGTTYAVGRVLDDQTEFHRELEDRARFFSLTPDLFVVSDESGRAAQVNAAWRTQLGWEPEDVVGEPFREFVHPDDVPVASRAARRALLRGAVVDLDIRVRRRDGDYRTYAWTVCRVPGRRVNYALGRDVTESKRAEERLRAILDSGPEALLVVDATGRIEFANRVLCRLLGYKPDELEGGPLDILLPREFRERHRDLLAKYIAAPVVRSMGRGASFPAARADGTQMMVRIGLSPLMLRDGAISTLAAVAPEYEPRLSAEPENE